jgi:hypothetical protein
MNLRPVVLAIIGALYAVTAHATTLPVTYDVEEKALKAAVSGTLLTFGAYRDAACTDLYYTDDIAIDDLKITKEKLFKVAGGAKPPKVATLHAVLTDSSLVQTSYVKVTGTGVAAVGGECQPQAGMAAGRVIQVAAVVGFDNFANLGGPAFQMIGGYATVFTKEGQTLSASVHAPLHSAGVTAHIGLCYAPAFSAGDTVNFASSGLTGVNADNHVFSAGGTVEPGLGAWEVGLCVQSDSSGAISTDGATGVVMVTQ